MRCYAFAKRNAKELLRDPINVGFGIGFPLVIMLLLSAIQANVPVPLFEINQLVPGIAIFGLSFISLFSATLISKDRSESFLMRLSASPLTPTDFILGYTIVLLPLAMLQSLVCYLVAIPLGLEVSIKILYSLIALIPCDIFFIGVGLLCGSLLSDKQVGGVCGALLTNLTAWLSGTWFDLELVGGWFKKIAFMLPFARAVNVGRYIMQGEYSLILGDIWIVFAYAILMMCLAIFVFSKKMKSDTI